MGCGTSIPSNKINTEQRTPNRTENAVKKNRQSKSLSARFNSEEIKNEEKKRREHVPQVRSSRKEIKKKSRSKP